MIKRKKKLYLLQALKMIIVTTRSSFWKIYKGNFSSMWTCYSCLFESLCIDVLFLESVKLLILICFLNNSLFKLYAFLEPFFSSLQFSFLFDNFHRCWSSFTIFPRWIWLGFYVLYPSFIWYFFQYKSYSCFQQFGCFPILLSVKNLNIDRLCLI